MTFDPKEHHRRSIRLPAYDYAGPGAYFVTVCTHQRRCFLGTINGSQASLSAAGRAVQSVWAALPERFPPLELDAFVVMPNHVHGVILLGLGDAGTTREWRREGAMNRAPTLAAIVRTFKAVSARLVRRTCAPEFAWQRNYYEHVVRSETALNAIRKYIDCNPVLWPHDHDNLPGHAVHAARFDSDLARRWGFTGGELGFIIAYENAYRGRGMRRRGAIHCARKQSVDASSPRDDR